MAMSPLSLGGYTRLVLDQTGSPFRAARFLLRSLVRFHVTNDWLTFIESSPVLSKTTDRVKSVLAAKIHRPFSHCAFGPAERAVLLMNHYRIAEGLFAQETLSSLVAGERLTLARIEGPREGEAYLLTLAREMISQHQGELTFLLIDGKRGLSLAMLMVNLTFDDHGRRILLLNGIQGPGAAYKDRIVRVTRDLNGLRPKRAVLEASYAFAAWMKAERIVATTLTNHVSQAKLKWQKKIHADYDDFWREFEPSLLPDGDFELPIPLPQRKIEDVPSKKKKNWLLRQEKLRSIAAQCAATFENIPSTPPKRG